MRHTRIALILAVLATFFQPISPAISAGTCTPTFQTNSASYTQKTYVFSGLGSCTWTVPTGIGTLIRIDLRGGGGGGGAGSFAGSANTSGGGGGGGVGGATIKTTGLSLTPGTSVSVSLGAGGTGGAATSLNAAGGNGSDGSATTWTPVSGTSLSAAGGSGGSGGSYSSGPIGGAGGSFPGVITNGTSQFATSGGSQNTGNGGGGAGPMSSYNATSTSGGFGGDANNGYLPIASGGGGGASGLNTNTGGGSTGASSSRAATTGSTEGSGGGGGAGCKSDTACANIAGATGRSGYIILIFDWGIKSSDSSDSFATGQTVNQQIALASPNPDTSTAWIWASGASLPAGLSVVSTATNNGIALYLQGVPTVLQSSSATTFSIRDPASGLTPSFTVNITITKGGQPNFALSDATVYSGDTLTLSASGALSSVATTYSSNSSSCVLSGTNNSTLTATAGTGSCTITASNAGDSNFNSASTAATITLAKKTPSLSLSASPTYGVTGSSVTLTATITSGTTGTISFSANSSTISGCGSVTISGTSAVCTWTPSSTSGSPFTLSAAYGGDSSYGVASASYGPYSVYAPTTISYTDTATVVGTALTITPTISGGAGSPSSWTWSIGKTSDGTSVSGITISGGTISTTTSLGYGIYAMTVTETDSVGVVQSATITITVNRATGVISLTPTTITGTVVPGITVNRQIQLRGSTGLGTGTGKMTFYANGTAVCTDVFVFSGTATCWWGVSDTSTALFTLTMTYTGDSNVNGGSSNTISNFPANALPSATYNDLHVSNGRTGSAAPTTSGGTGPASSWSWSIYQVGTGQQISGITINSSTGVVTVGSNTSNGTYTMQVVPTDVTNANNTATIVIYVAAHSAPTIVLWNSSETVTAGNSIVGYALLSTGGSIDTFTISPTVPFGMTFDTTTGIFSGTPTNGQSATAYTIRAYNSMGTSSTTYTLTVIVNSSGTTITIHLASNNNQAYKGIVNGIIADTSVNGKVTYYFGNKKIPGCISLPTSTLSATCNWKPAIRGGGYIYAALKPTSGSYTASRSANLNVGIASRTTKR